MDKQLLPKPTARERERERAFLISNSLLENNSFLDNKEEYFGGFLDNKRLFFGLNLANFWFNNRAFSYLLPEESG